MSVIQKIQAARIQTIENVNEIFDRLLQTLESDGVQVSSLAESGTQIQSGGNYESIYPLAVNPGIFKGKKPTGVLFGVDGRVDVGTWKTVFREILQRCNADPEKHVALMNLRGKISGRERIFLAKEADGMRSPLKLSENLYVETHYDTETLLRIMTTRILDAVGYDYSGISVAIRNG